MQRAVLSLLLLGICFAAVGGPSSTLSQRPTSGLTLPPQDPNSLGPYNVDFSRLTVGGLSSGGFMAVQLHVAFSSLFKGAAVFAGGPYGCAVGNVVSALTFCEHGPIPAAAVAATVANTKGYATSGVIDPVSNLATAKVFLFSGTKDTVVEPVVVKAALQYYEAFVTSGSVMSKFDLVAEHLMPTLDYGEDCEAKGSPYIGRCNYNGAAVALAAISPNPITTPSNLTTNLTNLFTFDQTAFIAGGNPNIVGLGTFGYIYVPTACQQGASCGVHLELHGCLQNYEHIGSQYAINAGYNALAEANNIIVLYPQTSSIDLINPEACWDWWGYTGENYLTRSGVQMNFAKRLVEALLTGKPSAQ